MTPYQKLELSRSIAELAYCQEYLESINRRGASREDMPAEAPCFLDTKDKVTRLVKVPFMYCHGDNGKPLHCVSNDVSAFLTDKNCWCGKEFDVQTAIEYGGLAALHYAEIDAYQAEEERAARAKEFPNCYVCCISGDVMSEPVNVCDQNPMHNMERSFLEQAQRSRPKWYTRGECPVGGEHCTGRRPEDATVNPVLKHMLDRWKTAKKGFIETTKSGELDAYANSPKVPRRMTRSSPAPPSPPPTGEQPLTQSAPATFPPSRDPPPKSRLWMLPLFALGIGFVALIGYGIYRGVLLVRELYLRLANFRLTR